jgi:hypothetical protein
MSLPLFLSCLGAYFVLDRRDSHAGALAVALLIFAVVHMAGGY